MVVTEKIQNVYKNILSKLRYCIGYWYFIRQTVVTIFAFYFCGKYNFYGIFVVS